MRTVRYYLALLLLSSVPPAFLFWFSIHPFIRFWRALGPRFTLAIHYIAAFALAGMIAGFGRPLLSVEFGTNSILIGLALPLLAISAVLRKRLSKQLRFGVLTGLPELAPERHKIPLLTEGIYARIRHPRYVQALLVTAAYALFCNFLATYILLLSLVLVLYLIVLIEERELRDRFGAEYDAYCARVPRFIPRFRPQRRQS
jgi:protein-S-isoprenylcysteine O-methyltransferase Ste14